MRHLVSPSAVQAMEPKVDLCLVSQTRVFSPFMSPCLPTSLQARTRQRLLALAKERQVDPGKASAALAAAYHAVTREGVLSEEAAKRAEQ